MKMENVLIMGAYSYDFEDEETGRQIKGVKFVYLDPATENEKNEVGMIPKFMSAPFESLPMLSKSPGIFDITFQVSMGKKRVNLVPIQFEFKKPSVISA